VVECPWERPVATDVDGVFEARIGVRIVSFLFRFILFFFVSV
jgi:hypothetical protein